MKCALYLMPRLSLATVDTTLIGLATLRACLSACPILGDSKNPLKMAPRQIAVRLEFTLLAVDVEAE